MFQLNPISGSIEVSQIKHQMEQILKNTEKQNLIMKSWWTLKLLFEKQKVSTETAINNEQMSDMFQQQ